MYVFQLYVCRYTLLICFDTQEHSGSKGIPSWPGIRETNQVSLGITILNTSSLTCTTAYYLQMFTELVIHTGKDDSVEGCQTKWCPKEQWNIDKVFAMRLCHNRRFSYWFSIYGLGPKVTLPISYENEIKMINQGQLSINLISCYKLNVMNTI